MKTKIGLILSLVAIFGICISLLVTAAFATTVQVLDGQISVTDTANSNTVSGGTVTITAKGSLFGKKTNTITITNETDSTATLSFDYAASKYSRFTIAGVAAPSASGSHSVLLDAGLSVTIALVSNSGLSNTTATLTLSNFSLTEAAASSNVTFEYDSALGSVTADGEAVTSGYTKEGVKLDTGVALVATPKSGATFLGWIDADTHERLSADASYTFTPASDMTVEAVFVSSASSANAWFLAGGNRMYDDLNEAGTYAASVSTKTVILLNSGTLPAGSYTIPSGVTLLIPCDAANTVYTTAPATSDVNSLTKPYAFRTLTMASGANIVVNGAISIAGTQHSVMAKGTPFGPVGFIKMNGNSSITINSGAKLYAWGYITGTGSVTVKSGGNVYECFQISDWRGGSATSAMLKNDEKIFPMSQYYVQNIEVPLTLEAGAKEHGFMSVKVSIVGIKSTLVSFIGDDGMFQIAGGSLTKDYDEANDRLVVSLNNANVSISPYTISVDAGTFGASITINSADYVLPITTNLTLNVNSGSTVTLSQDIAFLPGSEVNIEEGANCLVTSNSNIYVYDADDWGAYCGAGNAKLTTIAYAPGKLKTRTAADLVDAAVKINGTVDASAGYIYTTAGGANIYSTGSGELIQCAGTNTVTYQATYVKDGYTANEIAVTPAQLHNGGAENIYSGEGNEYTPTADATEKTTYNHCPDCLMWYTGSHTCAAAATYSVTITWNQTDVAVYTPGQTTYTWDPVNLKYSDSTTEGSWNDTQSVMTITINNSKSTGAVTASFVYNKQLHATESWTGLTNNALAVEAGKTGSASLTLTPTGTPTAPTDGTDTIILGTITITLSKENNST